jgi:hypothetical protein
VPITKKVSFKTVSTSMEDKVKNVITVEVQLVRFNWEVEEHISVINVKNDMIKLSNQIEDSN